MKRLVLLSISTLTLIAQSAAAQQPAPAPTPAPAPPGLRRPGPGVRPFGAEQLRNPPGGTPPAATAAPTTAPTPPPTPPTTGTGTGAGATGTGAAGAGTTGTAPTIGPNGKALSDTKNLTQFEQSMEFEPRSPNYKVSFSLEDADLAELVRVIGQLTGKRFIFGGKVKSIKATVYSPEKVTVAEAYQAFLSILEANGLTVVPHGRFLKIIETAGAASQDTAIYAGGQQAPNEERYVTRIHRLQHVGADEASNVLGKFKSKDGDITVYGPGNLLIITDTGTNIRRMISLLDEIDVGGVGDQMYIEPVHYASASDVANRVNELFDLKGGSGGGGPPPPTGKGGAGGGNQVGGGELHVAKVVADDRSNSLVIVSTERAYLRILELIRRLDVPQSGEGEIHVLPLQHADATDLTKTLNDIITGANTVAGGGATPATKPVGGAPASGIFEGGIKVSADKATNSIVVTSSLRDYASLRAVIDKLDQPRRQVFIEAVIMDLQLKRSNGFGVSFHGGDTFSNGSAGDGLIYGGNKILNTILPLPSDPDALQGFALGVRGPGISGTQSFLGTGISIPAFGTFVQALAQTGDSDLLSTPHILALDNEDAEINVGDNIPLQTNATPILAGLGGVGATGAAGAIPGLGGGIGGFGSPRQDVGTKVKIKPHLNDSNQVRLDVSEEISEQGAPLGGTLGAIPISKRTATTKLVVEDQQTVVIGGLIRNINSRAEDKIPVLGDIPVLGALFRKRTDKIEKRNLILILTPYIIREQADLRGVFERKMQERQEYLDRYFVFSDMNEYTPPRDYSRTNGLLEEIRQAFFGVDEKKKLDELTRPKELKGHDPQRPLEMPGGVKPAPGAAGATPGAFGSPAGGAPGAGTNPGSLNVNPQIRNVDHVEK